MHAQANLPHCSYDNGLETAATAPKKTQPEIGTYHHWAPFSSEGRDKRHKYIAYFEENMNTQESLITWYHHKIQKMGILIAPFPPKDCKVHEVFLEVVIFLYKTSED